jgi:hypothetical protein
MKASAGSNTTSVANTAKEFQMIGGHVEVGDQGKWIVGGTKDEDCEVRGEEKRGTNNTKTYKLINSFQFNSILSG